MKRKLEVGYEFLARRAYPFADNRESVDVKVGEKIKIIGIDEDGKFKLLNLSLGEEDAWIEVTEEVLLKLLTEEKKHMLEVWLNKNVSNYEIHKSTDGSDIAFVPYANAEKVKRYIERYQPHIRMEWRANYTWMAIFLG